MANRAIHLEPKEFIHHFLPLPDTIAASERPIWNRNVFQGLENAPSMTEASIITKFLAAVNLNGLAPGFTVSESQNLPAKGDLTMEKVDAAFFRSNNVLTDGRPHWADQVVAVEFKAHDTSKDPFDDRPHLKLDPDAAERKKVRGQIIEYAEHIFRYQQRMFLFMLLIIGRRFRFLYWDRSGTVTTRSVDYFEQPDVLCEMLWRMGHLTGEQLGYDPSARRILPSDTDYELMQLASMPHPADLAHDERILDEMPDESVVFRYVRQAFKQSLDNSWPRYCLDVPYQGRTRTFLVAKPHFFAAGMAGRGTRGYVALDRESGRFMWLKDAWRADYDLIDQEGSVLSKLNNEGVLNVPTLVCHGDILDQTTRTPELWEMKNPPPIKQPLDSPPVPPSTLSHTSIDLKPKTPSSKKRSFAELVDGDETPPGTPEECPLRRHMHYRLVVEEVAMDLKAFQSGSQLLTIIYDCVIAHYDAMSDAKIVHRDISGGNILILPKALVHPQTGQKMIRWCGMLADWELSKPVHEKSTSPHARERERTGTWQFMSVGTLSEHTKVVETYDELESFFHVTLYYAIRYLRSDCPDVGTFIEDYFDSYVVTDNKYYCGSLKNAVVAEKGRLLRSTATKDGVWFDSPLDQFFRSTLVWFKAHYTVTDYRKNLSACEHKEPQKLSEAPTIPAPLPAESGILPPLLARWKTVKKTKLLSLQDTSSDLLRKPTPQEEEDALKVVGHEHMLSALEQVIESPGWKALTKPDRVEGDNVPDNYTPKRHVGPPRGASLATFKRLKSGAHSYAGRPSGADDHDQDDTPSTPRRLKTVQGVPGGEQLPF
ncbi:hypothetical protein C8Q79DRAFT_1014107 [Trametes meyenii]|nr:hypothetical protein C8Q79DRAFT_1014107 [Trametes meyenii]